MTTRTFDANTSGCANCGSTDNWILVPHRLFYEFSCSACGFEETFMHDEVVVDIPGDATEAVEFVEGAA